MAGKSKKQIQIDIIAARRAQVSEWYFQFVPQKEMAEKLGVSPALISEDINVLQEEWLSNRKHFYNKWIIRELMSISVIEAEATEAWHKSKSYFDKDKKADPQRGDRTTTTYRAQDGNDYGSTTNRLSHGNPAYLKEMRECVQLRSKLLGLLVDRHEHSGEDGKAIPISIIEVVKPNARSGTG